MSEWIDVKDRLPEKDDYWGCKRYEIKENRVKDFAYYYSGRWCEDPNDMFGRTYHPTHWRDDNE